MKFLIFGPALGPLDGLGDPARAADWRAAWGGLLRVLARRGNRVVHVEIITQGEGGDGPPGPDLSGVERLTGSWAEVAGRAAERGAQADVVIVASTHGCVDQAIQLALTSGVGKAVYFDADPVATLSQFETGQCLSGLEGFDTVLSAVGGLVPDLLRARCCARRVVAFPDWVDTERAPNVTAAPAYMGDVSYVATVDADHWAGFEELFLAPARRLVRRRFVVAGEWQVGDHPLPPNLHRLPAPSVDQMASIMAASTLTLNLTAEPVRRLGGGLSRRLLGAALSGVPVISDNWQGIEGYFEPGREILIARETDDVTTAMVLPRTHLQELAARAKDRVLSDHSAERRVTELGAILGMAGEAGGDD